MPGIITNGVVPYDGAAWAFEYPIDADAQWSTKRWRAPNEDMVSGTFVEAPYPNQQVFFRRGDITTGGYRADHLLVPNITQGGLSEVELNLPVRQKVADWGDYCWLIFINMTCRIWHSLFATGSTTGAVLSTTPINTPLTIFNGIFRLQTAGDTIRGYLKYYDVRTEGDMILVEMTPKPHTYPLT